MGCEGRGVREMLYHPQHLWVHKSSKVFLWVRFQCPQHILVYELLELHSKNYKISFVGLTTFLTIFGQKAKTTTKVALYEPPTIAQFQSYNQRLRSSIEWWFWNAWQGNINTSQPNSSPTGYGQKPVLLKKQECPLAVQLSLSNRPIFLLHFTSSHWQNERGQYDAVVGRRRGSRELHKALPAAPAGEVCRRTFHLTKNPDRGSWQSLGNLLDVNKGGSSRGFGE